MSAPIPFNWPTLVGAEFDHVRAALNRGKLSGNGEFTVSEAPTPFFRGAA
jgi:hypothetical protein